MKLPWGLYDPTLLTYKFTMFHFIQLMKGEMKALLTTLCVGHALASGLVGLKLDWTEALLRPVLFIA